MAKSLGPQVVDWMMEFLVHGPGDIQGDPYFVDDEQLTFIVGAYTLDADGKRIVRRAGFSRAKGRAKSEMAAALSCAEALGPVRFSHWAKAGEVSWWGYPYEEGEPVGKTITRPEIMLVATEMGQTANVYSAVYYMLTEGPLAGTPGLDVGLTRTVLPDGGRILASTGAAKSKDGGRQTFVCFDETHLMDGRELKEMVAVLRRNLAKRKAAEPWSLETTTAYRQGEDSVAEDSHRYFTAVEEGRVTDPGLLWDHREGPADFDWDDDDQLLAALSEAYGDAASWMDLDRLVAEVRDPSTDPYDAQRYYLNRPAEYESSWMSPETWGPLASDQPAPERGTAVVLGFDGSLRDDATALVGATLDGHIFVVRVWEAPHGARDWEVNREDVDATVRESLERWDVRRLYADPALWQDYLASWMALHPGVVEWWTNRRKAMAEAIERFETAARASEMTHDGNLTLRRHVLAARRNETTVGTLLRKDRPKSPHKIDAAIAAVLAWEARADEVATGIRRSKQVVSW